MSRARARTLLLLACAAPHLLRMALPVTTVADSSYAHGAWMLSEGFTPYVHFAQVAFPLAEFVLAAAFALLGHDLRVVGACNLAVVLAVAAALGLAARRMVSWTGGAEAGAADARREAAARRAGVVAALAWSWGAWVVHYDFFERETWTALGTALALAALFAPVSARERASGAAGEGWRRAWAVGAGLALGFCVKITVLAPVGAVLAHLVLARGWRAAWRTGLAFAALVGAVTLACWWAWGRPFLEQVYLFGFFRAPNTAGPLDTLADIASFTDPVLALMFAALLACGLPGLRRPVGVPALVLLAELAFLTLVSPTFWNHNLISFYPPGALLLGVLAAQWSAGLALRMAGALAVVVAGVLALPAVYMPGMTASPHALAPYVEGWSREGIAHHAAFLQRHSAPGDVVCTLQPAYALAAGRVEFVRYLDMQPLALGVEAAVRADGVAGAWAARKGRPQLGPGATAGGPAAAAPAPGMPALGDPRLAKLDPYVARMFACSLAYDRPLLLDAIRQREIALFVEPLLPLVLGADELEAAGYERFEDHEFGLAGWRPAAGVGRHVVRELFRR
ncbi:MAG TPA: hypothetical protein VK824_06825 [Planctomycetota bacterium]|nr:hypothetical protein [Planctomycetota bacterium]